MTLSDFFKILYPYIGKDLKISEFVIHVTNQIMEIPSTSEDKQNEADDKYNPLSAKSASMLEKIFSGSRNFEKENARIINAHLDQVRFADFMETFSIDVITKIGEKLKLNEIEIIDNDITTTCALLFAKLLEEIANPSPKKRKRKTNIDSALNQLADKASPTEEQTQAKSKEKQFYQVHISDDLFDEIIMMKSMSSIFLDHLVAYDISSYIEGNPSNKVDISGFINSVTHDIIKSEVFAKQFANTVYKAIVEFCTELRNFHNLSALNHLELTDSNFETVIAKQRAKLKVPYKVIIKDNVSGSYVRDWDSESADIYYCWTND